MITAAARRTMFGKLTGKHVATLGKFTGEGTNKTEATLALHRTIEAVDTRRAFIICTDGHVLAVSQYAPNAADGGWGYDIVDPSSERGYAASCWGSATHDQAIEHASKHAEGSYGGVVRVVHA